VIVIVTDCISIHFRLALTISELIYYYEPLSANYSTNKKAFLFYLVTAIIIKIKL
jgi:hypothetical protein